MFSLYPGSVNGRGPTSGARGPEGADRQRNGCGTLKISAAAAGGRIGSGGRRRPCCEGRSAPPRGARGPEGADRQRNGGGTLKISAAGARRQRDKMMSNDDFGLRRFFRKNFEPGDFELPPPACSDADRGGSRHRSPMSAPFHWDIGSGGRHRPLQKNRARKISRRLDLDDFSNLPLLTFFRPLFRCARSGATLMIGSGGRHPPCCEGRSAPPRGARGPEGADRQRNGGGTLKISAAAGGRIGSGGRRRPCCEGRSAAERGARAEIRRRNSGGTLKSSAAAGGRIGSGGRRRPCCEGRSFAEGCQG